MAPLSGLRVVEFPAVGPVPFAGMLLAEMGAEVIRLTRMEKTELGVHVEPKYHTVFRSRPSLQVDLKKPEGIETALRLIERADGLIEGFRPGVMERLGLSPEVCHKRNPRLVYGRMTGWGQSGPLAPVAGHDINYIAISGALSTFGERGGAPVFPLNLVGDFGGGALYLVAGVLAAVIDAKKTGKGQVVDAAMVDGAASLMTHFYGFLGSGMWREGRGENIIDGGAHFYSVYETKDKEYIAIGPIEEKFYRSFLEAVGLSGDPELTDGFMERDRWPMLKQKIAGVIRTRTRQAWSEQLEALDVCVSPVLSMKEATRHPHMKARQAFVEVDGVVQPAPAPRFSGSEAVVRSSAAAAFDSREILQDWGIDLSVIDRLRSAQAIA